MFLITQLSPGSPVYLMAGENPSPGRVEEIKERWGLNDPLYIQLFNYLRNLARLDLGESMVTRRRVSADIGRYFPATLEVTIFSVLLGSFFGVFTGVISVIYKGRFLDSFIRMFSLVGVAMPLFWLGLMLLLVFYYHLGFLPGGGRISGQPPLHISGLYLLDSIFTLNGRAFIDSLSHLIMPSLCLSFGVMGRIARIARASMLSVYKQDYVRTARAKGLQERVVLYRYVLRNAAIPILTMSGETFGILIGGSVLTETIFSWPGLGRYAVQSAMQFDYPAITGFAIIATLMFALSNFIIDITYGIADPRIKYS